MKPRTTCPKCGGVPEQMRGRWNKETEMWDWNVTCQKCGSFVHSEPEDEV